MTNNAEDFIPCVKPQSMYQYKTKDSSKEWVSVLGEPTWFAKGSLVSLKKHEMAQNNPDNFKAWTWIFSEGVKQKVVTQWTETLPSVHVKAIHYVCVCVCVLYCVLCMYPHTYIHTDVHTYVHTVYSVDVDVDAKEELVTSWKPHLPQADIQQRTTACWWHDGETAVQCSRKL